MNKGDFKFRKNYNNNKFGDQILSFDFNICDFQKNQKGKNRGTQRFDFHETLLKFLKENPDKKIFLTRKKLEKGFKKEGNDFYVNIDNFQKFCEKLHKREDRANAFFRQEVSVENLSHESRGNILASTTEQEIIERIKNFSAEQKQTFLEGLKKIEGIELPQKNLKEISDEDFLNSWQEILKTPEKQKIIVANYSQIQISILEEHKRFLEDNLVKNETFIHNWLDGKTDDKGNEIRNTEKEQKRLRKSRCLIFGLEFINFKSKGKLSGKEFDILTKTSLQRNEFVLIELKSPGEEVFDTKEKAENNNEGKSKDYSFSDSLFRSIPQVLNYKHLFENASDEELQSLNVQEGKVMKCIILIGKSKKDDKVWERNFQNLKHSFSNLIEIWTYTDLIEKLDTTIKNLRENL